ncbi:MAG: hypothetical protein H0X29_00590 [Parachlamydiaceae bacterium]|nr:hypothetical protein [Parachlamydiaceae bacterium]
MDFTREPIIETVITPREGCKLVVRSSKSTAQEEYFVDAIEVVSFGHSFFFRSMERPKAFLVPVSDYEVLEVREARMVLKNVGIDRAIKIGGGRDAQMRASTHHEHPPEKVESNQQSQEDYSAPVNEAPAQGAQADAKSAVDPRLDKKRDRRRQYRRRRGREDGVEGAVSEESSNVDNKELAPRIELAEPRKLVAGDESLVQPVTTASILTSLLPPPSTLISETIARYKDNALFRGAFYSKEEPKPVNVEEKGPVIPIEQPEYGSFEVSEEEEERIYQQRKQQSNNEGEDDESNKPESPLVDSHQDDASMDKEAVAEPEVPVENSERVDEYNSSEDFFENPIPTEDAPQQSTDENAIQEETQKEQNENHQK